jgi:hypothetical protein
VYYIIDDQSTTSIGEFVLHCLILLANVVVDFGQKKVS